MSNRHAADSQLNLPPGLLPKREHQVSVLPKQEQQPEVPVLECDALAAQFFDEALTGAKLTNAEVAYLIGVSESLVRKMRSKDSRERVSFAQMLRLPPSFHIELHKAMNRRYGFGRQALVDLLDAVGRLALAVDR